MHAADALSRLINPMAEDAHWRQCYQHQCYYRPGLGYEDYGPAYRVGYTAPLRREGSFDSLQDMLRLDWEQVKGRSRLSWSEARQAVRVAWDRVTGDCCAGLSGPRSSSQPIPTACASIS